MRKLIISLFLSILWLTTYGQQFPVQAQLQLLPPHSPFLDDWGEAFPNKTLLLLTLVDGFESGYPVRLRWTISGNGIELRSNPNFTPTPIALNFGVPRALMGPEVAEYLNPDNLEFTGLARNDFIQSGGKLPEGLYTVCVEVLDFNRFDGFPVSAPACFMMLANELDPPLLIAPTDYVEPQPVQNILFQWQPAHVGAFPVNYQLQVFEKVAGMSNDLVLQTQVPYFQTTVMMQQAYLYGAAAPPLIAGKDYIFRVQIIDPMGANAFKNQGYSQIGTFTYGEEIMTCNWEAVATEATSVGGASFVANWEALEAAESYRLDVGKDTFFEAFVDGFVDFEIIDSTHFTIYGLEAETNYWYRVRGVKTLENGEECVSAYSNVIPVKIKTKCTQPPEEDEVAYECGLPTDMSLEEAPLIASLAEGDSIYAAGFQVVLTKIGGGSSAFSGEGYVANIPFLAEKLGNKVRVNVQFENIAVNENCQLVDGEIVVTGAGAAIVSDSTAMMIAEVVRGLEAVDNILEEKERLLNEARNKGVENTEEESETIIQSSQSLLQEAQGIANDSTLNSLAVALADLEQFIKDNPSLPKACEIDTSSSSGGGDAYLDFSQINRWLGIVSDCEKTNEYLEKLEEVEALSKVIKEEILGWQQLAECLLNSLLSVFLDYFVDWLMTNFNRPDDAPFIPITSFSEIYTEADLERVLTTTAFGCLDGIISSIFKGDEKMKEHLRQLNALSAGGAVLVEDIWTQINNFGETQPNMGAIEMLKSLNYTQALSKAALTGGIVYLAPRILEKTGPLFTNFVEKIKQINQTKGYIFLQEKLSNLFGLSKSIVDDFARAIGIVAKQFVDYPNIQKYIDEKGLSSEVIELLKSWKDIPNLLTELNKDFGDADFYREFDIFGAGVGVLGKLKAWKIAYEAGSDLKTNINVLEMINHFSSNGLNNIQIKNIIIWARSNVNNVSSLLTTRVQSTNGFSIKHTVEQLEIILIKAKGLNLTSKEIDDLLFISCRDSNPINANKLMQQMDDWVNEIKLNGYPYKFVSTKEFNDFGVVLKSVAANFNLPLNKFYIQGSTLRNRNLNEIGDIDIAILVNNIEFDALTKHFIDMSISPTNISKIQADVPKGIIRDVNMRMNQNTSGTFRGHFYNAFENSIFKTTPMDYFGIEKVNISIVKITGNFDVSPYLKIN